MFKYDPSECSKILRVSPVFAQAPNRAPKTGETVCMRSGKVCRQGSLAKSRTPPREPFNTFGALARRQIGALAPPALLAANRFEDLPV